MKHRLLKYIGSIKQSGALSAYQRSIEKGLLTVGKHTYGYPRILVFRDEQGLVEIGSYCSISDDVKIILSGRHRWWVTSFPIGDPFGRAEIMSSYNTKYTHTIIGSDVWIGYGATVIGGVKIGDGAVIGALAVVDKNIPPYAVVAGNRARILGYRFSPEEISALIRIQWWGWSDDKVREALPLLASIDPTQFIQKYGMGY
jgi:acetyltransferase-like isoleucine patch superfamily enzyme